MNRLTYIYRKVRSWIRPLTIVMDGRDNTITINDELYRLLVSMGVEDRNNIFAFHISGHEYGFCILPPDMNPAETITAELKYNIYYKTFGFEMLCPTIQSIFYNWSLSHDRVVRTKVTIERSSNGLIYFSIIPNTMPID